MTLSTSHLANTNLGMAGKILPVLVIVASGLFVGDLLKYSGVMRQRLYPIFRSFIQMSTNDRRRFYWHFIFLNKILEIGRKQTQPSLKHASITRWCAQTKENLLNEYFLEQLIKEIAECFPNIFKMMELVLVIPISTAPFENRFLSLKPVMLKSGGILIKMIYFANK